MYVYIYIYIEREREREREGGEGNVITNRQLSVRYFLEQSFVIEILADHGHV